MSSLAGVNINSDSKTKVKKVNNNSDNKTKVKNVTYRNNYGDETPVDEDVQIKSKHKSKYKLPSLSRQFG